MGVSAAHSIVGCTSMQTVLATLPVCGAVSDLDFLSIIFCFKLLHLKIYILNYIFIFST